MKEIIANQLIKRVKDLGNLTLNKDCQELKEILIEILERLK